MEASARTVARFSNLCFSCSGYEVSGSSEILEKMKKARNPSSTKTERRSPLFVSEHRQTSVPAAEHNGHLRWARGRVVCDLQRNTVLEAAKKNTPITSTLWFMRQILLQQSGGNYPACIVLLKGIVQQYNTRL